MWKYRDWVIDALNRDMPFDRFTIEQIAGDMLPNATPAQQVASGFHRNAMTNEEGGIDPDEAQYEVLVDRVNTTATVWLGTTLGCAQCHNHKYDPFSQKDYYRMMAFFQNSDYEVRKLGDGTKFTEPAIDVPTPEQEAKQKTIQAEIDLLNAQIRTQTPALARAQVAWEHECGSSRRCVAGVDAEEPRGGRRRGPDAGARRLGPGLGRQPGRDDLYDRGRRRLFRASRRFVSRRCRIRRCRKADRAATCTATSR